MEHEVEGQVRRNLEVGSDRTQQQHPIARLGAWENWTPAARTRRSREAGRVVEQRVLWKKKMRTCAASDP
jgi:hypothetical protein